MPHGGKGALEEDLDTQGFKILHGGGKVGSLILVINPGSTSTKLALYLDEARLADESVYHDPAELLSHSSVADQLPLRATAVRAWTNARLSTLSSQGRASRLSAIAARGGLLRPLPGGTYLVDDAMLSELRDPATPRHAANLAALIAADLAAEHHVPAYVVDPVSVDEMDDVARISGLPELPRISLSHALSMKAAGRRAASELGKPYDRLNLVIAHLGGGISVSAHRRGRMVDVNNANDMGPFSPERVGTLPLTGLLDLCASTPRDQLRKRLWGGGGLVAHLGTSDAREVERRIAAGDERASLVYRAMAYTVAKEIGAMSAAIGARPDAIVLTGGLAHSSRFVEMVSSRVDFIARVMVYPGGYEMEALAIGALRALRREEEPRPYGTSDERRMMGDG